MSTLTIGSNVYVNDDASTTERFTSITLTSVQANQDDKVGPTTVSGMEGSERPVTFTWTGRFVREVIRDSLLPIAAKSVLMPTTRNANGDLEAVIGDGELCKFSWEERDRRDESTQTLTQWGYFVITDTNLAERGRDRATLVLYPADRIRFRNSDTYLSKEQDA